MDDRTISSQRPYRANIFWRRRVAALVLSMAVLAGITWSAAAAFGASGGGRTAEGRPRPPARSLQHSSSAATASGAETDVSAESGLAVPVHPAGRQCPPGDVVVTLSATQASYAAWQQPEFAVDLVSSANYACAFDIGAAHVVLQISAGTASVWTSADCAEGPASQLTTLQRSRPALVSMTWDSRYSSAGCPVPGLAAPPGTYTARATDGSAVSNDVTFTIT